VFGGDGHDGQAGEADEFPGGEGRVGLDFPEGDRSRQPPAGGDVDDDEPSVAAGRVGVGGGENFGNADDGFFFAGVVDEDGVAGGHPPHMGEGAEVADAVPAVAAEFFQVGVALFVGFGFHQPEAHPDHLGDSIPGGEGANLPRTGKSDDYQVITFLYEFVTNST